jgi:DNA mismatch repair protein MSH4
LIAGEVGVACLSEERAELQLSQVIDTSHAYKYLVAELLSIYPDIILLLETKHADSMGVNQAVNDARQLSECAIHYVGRHAFDDTAGMELINRFCTTDEPNLEVLAGGHYLACGCAGAILGTIISGTLASEGIGDIEPQSLLLKKRTGKAYCQLGLSTILSLQLITDNRLPKAGQWSLVDSIAVHMTKAGARMLRASLLQPLISVPTITERQNAIGELMERADVQSALQSFLSSMPNDAYKCITNMSRIPDEDTSGKAASSTSTTFIQSVLRLRSLLMGVKVLHLPMFFLVDTEKHSECHHRRFQTSIQMQAFDFPYSPQRSALHNKLAIYAKLCSIS